MDVEEHPTQVAERLRQQVPAVACQRVLFGGVVPQQAPGLVIHPVAGSPNQGRRLQAVSSCLVCTTSNDLDEIVQHASALSARQSSASESSISPCCSTNRSKGAPLGVHQLQLFKDSLPVKPPVATTYTLDGCDIRHVHRLSLGCSARLVNACPCLHKTEWPISCLDDIKEEAVDVAHIGPPWPGVDCIQQATCEVLVQDVAWSWKPLLQQLHLFDCKSPSLFSHSLGWGDATNLPRHERAYNLLKVKLRAHDKAKELQGMHQVLPDQLRLVLELARVKVHQQWPLLQRPPIGQDLLLHPGDVELDISTPFKSCVGRPDTTCITDT